MADLKVEEAIVINGDEEEEKWIQHYSSSHGILLVGEGDFSFSLSLAHSFASALNIVTSSLQLYDGVIKRFKNGKSNLEKLKALGGTILHGVDATKLHFHADLRNRKFDRIIFNFPHAGCFNEKDKCTIRKHQNLVAEFFGSAKRMLRTNGEIHVTHKTTHPFSAWDIPGLASQNSLTCTGCPAFNKENFPGYSNKFGAGSKCDGSFDLGECMTFKFILDTSCNNMQRKKLKKHNLHEPSQKFQETPNIISPPTNSFPQRLSSIGTRNYATYINGTNGLPSYAGLPARHEPNREVFRTFTQENIGREEICVGNSLSEALHRCSLTYMVHEHGRPSERYFDFSKKLHRWSPPIYSFLQQLSSTDTRNSSTVNGLPSNDGLTVRHEPNREVFGDLKGHFSYTRESFRQEEICVENPVSQALHSSCFLYRAVHDMPPEIHLGFFEKLYRSNGSRI